MRTKAESVAAGKARRTSQWPRRTLTLADGEYILWHVLDYLRIDRQEHLEASETVKDLLQLIWDEQNGSARFPQVD